MTKNDFSVENIKDLVQRLYRLNVTVKPLVSYIDRNFLLKDEEGVKYIFKIANSEEDRDILESQNGAFSHIAQNAPHLKCPRLIPTADGEEIVVLQGPEEQSHLARLLTFLPGTLMADHKGRSDILMENFGRFLGQLSKTLQTYSHPALVTRDFIWDLKNAMQLENYLEAVKSPARRNLTAHFLRLYAAFAVPLLNRLPKSAVQNDANDYNTLLDEKGEDIVGLFDFGDLLYTFRVSEPAVAAAYAVHYQDDPLHIIKTLVTGFHRETPLTDAELEVMFPMVCARLCATIIMSAHELSLKPENLYLEVSVKPAVDALEKLVAYEPRQVYTMLQEACKSSETADTKTSCTAETSTDSHIPVDSKPGLSPKEILAIRERHLGKALSVSYKKPLKIVRGYMQYLYDQDGRAYLDTVNNVCHIGHCHPTAVKAAQQQISTLNTNTRYLHDNIVEYAQRLCATLPDPLSVCFFVCTGSEANELAIRMAKTHTGNADFVVLDHAYHGNTNAVIDISPYKFNGPGGKGKPENIHVGMIPDVYRGPYKAGPDAGEKYAADVLGQLEAMKGNKRKPAAFIHESFLSVAGQIPLPENYLQLAYKHIREAGGICHADEVQVGFGRVGTHMWAFEQHGVVPDIVTMGKPIGNGHPLAAVVTTPEIAESFSNGMEYFNTFGGNPVSCAIGKAVLDVIENEDLQKNALEVGRHMKAGLENLMEKHAIIGDVRGSGLFLGIELVKDRETLEPAAAEASEIAEKMRDRGILVSVDGPLYNVLKIKPPMVFNKADADRYVNTLAEIL
ncbi:MAG: aminotransferase class III-fold pyridoxal phosphate-dependent enzyme [bacterium]|nr:aminotransferase class III-fold pyridoxal phosphate-dependent enzyme [bacterium]